MTHSQIQYLRDTSDALKRFANDLNTDAAKNPLWVPDKNVLRVKKVGSGNQLQMGHLQDRGPLNENHGAQSMAISPS